MQNLNDLLSSSKIRIVNTAQNRLQELNKNQTEIFNNYKSLILDKLKKLEINISYRGDKKSILKKTMFQGTDKYHDYDFYSRIFNLGGKTKQCYTGGNDFTIKKIDDTSSETFKNIFNELNDIFNNYIDDEDIGYKLQLFRIYNPDIYKFFSTNSNLEKFEELINPLCSNELIWIRDYYIYLIHVFGKTKIYYNSPLISTSYSFNTAKSFGTNKNQHDDCIIYIYLITMPMEEIGIDEGYLDGFKTYQSFSAFPLIKKTVFPEEKEFSVFGALFPHNIIGIYDLKKDKTIINSHLFLNNNPNDLELCANEGFDIPIYYFDRSFKDSTYVKGVEKIGRTFKDIPKT
ncbi:hypothetical protein [Halarcobacter anaerophilus]|uniref:hypothetical protein n=1 Tax=Halarcobacter anaerophilus TaxID=877500 RepID=UPI0005C9EB2D|nr:hypothetical protein [Halarcobacter anaerophilus]